MKAITVRQPWAWAIIHGGKDVENRSRNIAGSYRGPMAIHAGKTYDDAASWSDAMDALLDALDVEGCAPWESASNDCRGAIIGVVDLVGVHHNRTDALTTVCFDDHTPVGRTCSPWAEQFPEYPGGVHLALADPRPCEPIPCRGALGLWTVPDEIAARIEVSP